MGNKMAPETLEDCLFESKLSQTENPCNKIQEEVGSVSLCNLSNNTCTTDVYYGDHCGVSDVELAGKLGNESLKESMFYDGVVRNNEVDKRCFLNSGDDINYDDVLDLEKDLNISVNDGYKIEELDELMEKGEQVLYPYEPDSPTGVEVSGNSTNLFVDVFGSSGGSSNLKDAGKEFSVEKIGTLTPDVENVIFNNEGGKIVEQEFKFDVGDLVWVKTRTPLWWPGVISDPSNAANDATKSEKKGTFIVKFFGSANFVWCNNSELKPFIEFYEPLSKQNNSRNFCGSVERALCEIGRRVKSKMMCPCFSKDNITFAAEKVSDNKEGTLTLVEKKSKRDVLSLSQFEPAKFLSCIKQFAGSVHAPDKIELVVTKNHLSSFYRSIGHPELPLQTLYARDVLVSEVKEEGLNHNTSGGREKSVRAKKKRNPSDYSDLAHGDKIGSCGKSSDSRERKKSKYLSYPFVDVNDGPKDVSNKEQETEDLEHSTPLDGCNGKNSKKKGSKKSLKRRHIVSKADDINASSSELLAELCSSACDNFYLGRSKYSDSLKRFYSGFRSYAFLDADIANVDGGAQPEKRRRKNSSSETERQKEGINAVKESENPSSNLASGKKSLNDAVGDEFLITGNTKAKESVVCTSAKKERVKLEKKSSGVGKNINRDSSCMISFLQTCSDVPKSDPISGLPDSSTSNPIRVEHIQVGGSSSNLVEPVLEPKKEDFFSPNLNGFDHLPFASVPSSNDVKLTPQNIQQFNNGIIDTSQGQNGNFLTSEVGSSVVNIGLGSFIHQSPPLGFFPKIESEKGERMEKNSQFALNIPDLNEFMFGMSSSENNPLTDNNLTLPDSNLTLPDNNLTLPDNNLTSPEIGTQKKRGRKRSASVEEDRGGSLVLNFAPGSDLPTHETFVATFTRFGLLAESPIHILDESTVQIVYARTPDVKFAHRSLEKRNPFGEALIGCTLHLNSDAKKTTEKKKNLEMQKLPLVVNISGSEYLASSKAMENNIKLPTHQQPLIPVSNPMRPDGTPDIAFMKQHTEMMRNKLDEMGDNMLPEVRANLEYEIKRFLDKYCSMGGGSSSSS